MKTTIKQEADQITQHIHPKDLGRIISNDIQSLIDKLLKARNKQICDFLDEEGYSYLSILIQDIPQPEID